MNDGIAKHWRQWEKKNNKNDDITENAEDANDNDDDDSLFKACCFYIFNSSCYGIGYGCLLLFSENISH